MARLNTLTSSLSSLYVIQRLKVKIARIIPERWLYFRKLLQNIWDYLKLKTISSTCVMLAALFLVNSQSIWSFEALPCACACTKYKWYDSLQEFLGRNLLWTCCPKRCALGCHSRFKRVEWNRMQFVLVLRTTPIILSTKMRWRRITLKTPFNLNELHTKLPSHRTWVATVVRECVNQNQTTAWNKGKYLQLHWIMMRFH